MDAEIPSPIDVNTVAAALAARIARVASFAGGVRAAEIEAIHDMRVASRRLRAALRVWGDGLAPEGAARLSAEARDITRGLGRARELDVMLGLLAQEVKRATGPWAEAVGAAQVALREARGAAGAACTEAVDIATGWGDAKALAATLTTGWQGDAAAMLHRRLEQGLGRLWRAQRRWLRHGREDDLHALRIAFKKYRYTCELFAPHCAGMAGLLVELKAAQEALGDWNDFRLAAVELEALALSVPTPEAQALAIEALRHRAAEYLAAFDLQAQVFFTDDTRRRIATLWAGPLERKE